MLIFLLHFFPPKAGRLHKSFCRVPLTTLLLLDLWLGILSSLTRTASSLSFAAGGLARHPCPVVNTGGDVLEWANIPAV